MPKTEAVILTNMCMVTDGDKVLVQDRQKSWKGLVFPGGKIGLGESVVASVRREVYEETGLTVADLTFCGIKQFPMADGTRYVVFLYKTSQFTGELRSSDEGEVFWLDRKDLDHHQLASGFAEMLPIFENDSLSELYCQQDAGDWIYTYL